MEGGEKQRERCSETMSMLEDRKEDEGIYEVRERWREESEDEGERNGTS